MTVEAGRERAAEYTQKTAQPKQGKSAFDEALENASPHEVAKAVAPMKTSVTTPAKKMQATQVPQDSKVTQKLPAVKSPDTSSTPEQTPSSDSSTPAPTQQSDDDAVRSARVLAVLNSVPLTQLVAPSPGFEPEPEPLSFGKRGFDDSDTHAVPQLAGTVRSTQVAADATSAEATASDEAAPEAVLDDAPTRPEKIAARPSSDQPQTAPVDALSIDNAPSSAPSNPIDASQIAQLIDNAQPKSPSSSTSHDREAQPEIAAVMSNSNVAVATPNAVTAASEAQASRWHGLAEKIADLSNDASGSIEGNRARVVFGAGDDRVVLTVSTNAQRVAIEVDTTTRAGSQLAEALRGGAGDLRQALGRHGLELDNGQSQAHAQEQDLDETQAIRRVRPTGTTNTTLTTDPRPTGVVLA